ncbi:cellulase family glycosylhydrolase [Saccharicrinis aurantiacus]|uniref:cellulase family glycosylhydrolase n=1 Tax=Saccharicrinis aurantiacus TaxID=1849719 RepID=UPI00248F61A6|nr:cellulase family glycosylhydrolase [Saccharicrinis aurantiacus]
MFNVIRYFPIIVLLIFQACTQPGFKTDNNTLLDSNNKPFVIRGVNNPNIWYPQKAYDALECIAQKGTNCIRVVWETNGKCEELEKIILRCIELEMVVMIELHDATGDSSNQSLFNLVQYYTQSDIKEMLLKYEDYLLINIANEWGNHLLDDQYWYSSYKSSVSLLREAGYSTTIVIDGSGWGQDISPILSYGNALIDGDKNHNILFSIHMYGSWNSEESIDRQLNKAKKLRLPIIIGEFGYNFQNGINNLACKVNHLKILETCNRLGYGYIAWSWTGNNEDNAWLNLVDPNDWQTLSYWGDQVFNSEFGIANTSVKASIFD